MSARPWMKFYPSDWRADPALRVCSLAARGLWMEMLCVMHEAVPRGRLMLNGSPMNHTQLAALVGSTGKEVQRCLDELEAAGVFSRDALGVLFSRRMVRDTEQAERDKANGGKGGNPYLKGGVNPPDKAQIPEARDQTRSSNEKRASGRPDEIRTEFDREFWPGWPNKVGKPAALKAFRTARKRHELAAIIAGRDRYVRDKPPAREWLNPATFLNQERFNDQPASTESPLANGRSRDPHEPLFRAVAEQFAAPAGVGVGPPGDGGGHGDHAAAGGGDRQRDLDLAASDYRRAGRS